MSANHPTDGSAVDNKSKTINPHLFKLKILEYLKNNNYEDLILYVDSISNFTNKYELLEVKNLIVHLAVQVSPFKLISKLLSEENRLNLDINYQDVNGNTPLHLAVLNNRLDVVQLLLRDERVNDTLLNNDLKQPIGLASDNRMMELLQFERSKYVEKIASEFRRAFTEHDFAKLDEILSFQRNYELLDINGTDPETGDTVLHEFIRTNDIGMVRWILSHGGDPFKRDRRGKLPIDLVAKNNDTLRGIILESSKEQSVIDQNNGKIAGIQAPTNQGYLKKWTNFATGYKLRWFVLDSDGILTYYKSQDDTNNACRGSLNMKYAILHLDSSEKLKFEILGKGGVSFHLMGNHPVETNRWVWCLQGAIRYAKDKEREARRSIVEIKKTAFEEETMSASAKIDQMRTHSVSMEQSECQRPLQDYSAAANNNSDSKNSDASNEESHTPKADYYNDSDDEEDDEESEQDFAETIGASSGPYSKEISVLKSSFPVQLLTLKEILNNIKTNPQPELLHDIIEMSIKSVDTLSNEFTGYTELINKRDEKLIRIIRKQRGINELWINSIKQLENELVAKTTELETFETERKKIRKVLSRRFNPESSGIDSKLSDADDPSEALGESVASLNPNTSNIIQQDEELSKIFSEDVDSDDEFFDADDFSDDENEEADDTVALESEAELPLESTDSGTEVVTSTISVPEDQFKNPLQKKKTELLSGEGSFLGYEDPLRTELPVKDDDRPKVGLWGILKSMIGKDITKIALPVAFNEPTSMLQRLAEDLEYSVLLDKAATFEDSTLRLLYIATFASSPYASTVDRVAKPFNPLLGETFEYSRPDLGFRYLSEQVSHHPPISAMLTESVKWDYYGETFVKSAFTGRSFDVQPLGLCYVHLRPDHSQTEEIYTWKKISTSVVGIMLGNPTIDNYGELVIVNNQTGDEAHLTFKARGWRASSAYEMSGYIQDKDGVKKWAIGGHWNSKIYGKKIVGNNDTIGPLSAGVSGNDTSIAEDGSKFIIWQSYSRPNVPFHLTNYALTLNDLPGSLEQYLADSDSRLRPDQRAMENGQYESADELKRSVEEKQRASRKDREAQGIEYQPRFFEKVLHPLSNEYYWKYKGDYWNKRSSKNLPNADIF
ncbi:hypothetical protein WICPIJ_003379 [Wickerhamomyces pijperi]|uniref:PH domain-containing protein n=1 Tax=Wickerhamomyces pijperi TaxID=599730 RepID=A0A9P8Q9Q8_WICPI|nr:hypothetical protein WICPIJ_003379 [Wickerhamomyces pijperi]